MGKRLKEFCIQRRYVLLLMLIVVIGAGWIVFLLDRHVYPIALREFDLEQRLAFVSLWVAIVGFSLAVAGTVIAVFQFQASQRKPDLNLWIDEKGQTTFKATSAQEVITLIAQNGGTRVARYIKCRVRFSLPARVSQMGGTASQHPRVGLYHASSMYPQDCWEFRGTRIPVATLMGGDDYFIYDKEPRQELGMFSLNLHGLERERHKVEYELRCEGMEWKQGVLWIELPEEVRQAWAGS